MLGALLLSTVLAPSLPALAQTPAATEADLTGLKQYLVDQIDLMKGNTAVLVVLADDYYARAEAAGFDYEALWADERAEVTADVEQARAAWLTAHNNYELGEGLVAGIPSLAHFDVLIDAGQSGADDPEGALDNQVELPNGEVLDRPGSYFHYLTEPALWGTTDAYVGLRVDLDGDGADNLGDAIPDANVLLGAARALDSATADLQTAVAAWEPTLADAFTAMVVMIPTMDGYFAEWSLSPYVLGDQSMQPRFVGISRLADVAGILTGLEVTYQKVAPVIAEAAPDLHQQSAAELQDLIAFVNDLYEREEAGTRFTPEQADQFGTELQTRADALAGQIAQVAALLEIDIRAE
jgi:hypothetical protein